MTKHGTALLVALACVLGCGRAFAQFDLSAYLRLAQSRQHSSSRSLPSIFAHGRTGGVPVVVRSTTSGVSATDLTSLGNFAVGELDPGRVLELAALHPEWSFDWAPPRHALLDRIESWVHAAAVRKETQTSGQGVVVGIVDTGLDLTHPDFQTADHKTRVAWLLDSARSPARLQAALETSYGCNSTSDGCAVYSGNDLDGLLARNADLPTDPFGHGTHVASLAAGNGLGSATPRYIGVAPEATFVIARVASSTGSIQDPDVLRGVQFVFDRAEELGMPAVVNLSLGSDFGAHDGSSALETELSNMVGPTFPGRAIVVAAGNSAGLYDGFVSEYPGPFGIHTEVHIPDDSTSIVPLITPALTGSVVNGTAYVWIEFRDGDDIQVAIDDANGPRTPLVAVGDAYTNDPEDPSAPGPSTVFTVLNGIEQGATTGSVTPGRHGAIVVIDGNWPANSDFSIRLQGHGTAELWVQGVGDLDPELGLGALFPRSEKEGTINVPASAASLIAVGATLNRTTWVDSEGTAIDIPDLGATDNAPLDTIAYFSAAGPNALGVIKPDIVAPGVWVAGAMAQSADPRTTGSGLFSNSGRCPVMEECFVVDDKHAITSGTSMSAPIVAGAIALLFQRDSTLTQDAVRAILQAGARPLQGLILDPRQIGPGALDLEGALTVASAGESPALRIPSNRSWLTVSQSYAHPDPTWPLTCYLDLRDAAGNIADGFDTRRLQVQATPAQISEPLTRVASGFYRFALTTPAGTGGQTLHIEVSFDDQGIAVQDLPIAVDRWVAEDGVSAQGGGCAISRKNGRSAASALLAAGLGLTWLRRRHIRAK